MTTTVYADILFIINSYITYILLSLTCAVAKGSCSRKRRAVGAVLGGLYSFVIFIPSDFEWVIAPTRILFAALLIFLMFGKCRFKRYASLCFTFFLLSFVFAGFMLCFELLFSPQGMMCFGSVVYFELDALTVIVITLCCYLFISLAGFLLRKRRSFGSVFSLTVYCAGKTAKVDCFLDTGNRLTEPFSSLPVVIAEKSRLSEILSVLDETKLRFIPCTSVSGQGILPAFRPDKISVTGAKTQFETSEVYIALSEEKICGGEFGALLNEKLFSAEENKGDYYVFSN